MVPSNLENTLVSAQCHGNSEYHNEVEYTQIQPNNSSQGQEVDIFCSYCREKGTLRKFTKCYTAEYCGSGCQTKHWKKQKKVCQSLLKLSSILLSSIKRWHRGTSSVMCHHHGLKGVGPNYSEPPPENGKRFIVKVQQAYDQFDLTSISLVIYDRSLTISESFQSAHVQNLIRDLGAICERKYIEKKLFMWASYTENKVIRIFTNDFPPVSTMVTIYPQLGLCSNA